MLRRRSIVASTLLTIGGCLLAVGTVKSALDPLIQLPGYFYVTSVLTGAASIVSAVAIFFFGWIEFPTGSVVYGVRAARLHELREVYDIGVLEIGRGLGNYRTIVEWYHKNRNTIYVVEKTPARGRAWYRSKVVGFFCVLPINAEAARRLRLNREGGLRILADFVTAQGQTPAALYISGVAGIGIRTRAKTLDSLRGFVAAGIASGITLFFASPVTEIGLRLLRRHGFQPTTSNTPPFETVYYRDFALQADSSNQTVVNHGNNKTERTPAALS